MLGLQLYNFFIAVGLLACRFAFSEGFNPWFTFAVGVISIFSFVVHHLLVRAVFPGKTLLGIPNLLGLSYIIVFFQYGIMAPFFEEVRESSLLWHSGSNVNSAIALAGVCFHLILMGYCYGLNRGMRRRDRRPASVRPEDLASVCRMMPLLGMAALGLFLANVGRDYLMGAYAGSGNWTPISRYIFLVFSMVFYLGLGFEVYRAKLSRIKGGLFTFVLSMNKLTLMLTGFFLVFNIYTGDRGPIISTTLILVAGADFHVKRYSFIFVMLLMGSALFSMYFIARYRTRDANMSLEERIEKGKEAMEGVKWYDMSRDLAGSIRTLVLADEIVPKKYPFFKGKIQLGHIVGVVPFSRGVLYRLGFVVGATSSNFFTTVLLGPGSTIGVGSSLVADVYIDFGTVGCIVIFFIFGRCLGWLEGRAFLTTNIYWIILHLMLVSNAVYWSRATLLGDLDTILWTLGLLYLIHTHIILNTMRLARIANMNKRVLNRYSSGLPASTLVGPHGR